MKNIILMNAYKDYYLSKLAAFLYKEAFWHHEKHLEELSWI